MELLCLAPSINFANKPKFTSIPISNITNMKIMYYRNMRGSRVRPLSALPLKMSRLISQRDSSAPVVSTPVSLEDIKPGELIENNPTGGDSEEMLQYLLDILASRVYDVAIDSPLQCAEKLSKKLGVNFFIKREDKQSVFSFKLRGAYNMMTKLTKEQLDKGVITASAGNHAQGVALGAQVLKCTAKIVMPVTTPDIKREAVENLGGIVISEGNTFDESNAIALEMSERDKLTFIPPFDHPDVVKGQGTVAAEIFRQLKDVYAVFVPVGGGGLIAGVAAYFKKVAPHVKIIGVEPYGASSMTVSLQQGERVKLDQVDNFADGVAVALVGEVNFRLCQELIDGMVLVGRDAISAAVKDVYDEGRNILETSGALAIAGAEAYCKYYNIKDENIVAIASGANMDFSKLKLVVDLADIGAEKEALLATFLPEEPGSFKKFCEHVGSLNITEFRYRFNSGRKHALFLYSVDVSKKLDVEEMIERLKSSDMKTVNLSNNDLVKEHLKHLIGGRSDPGNEIFVQFIFPEKPGALRKFLEAFTPRWNITLFHYREQGEIDASVLVGFQVTKAWRRLTTVDRLSRFGINVPQLCIFCGGYDEMFDHLYFECAVTRSIWSRTIRWVGYARVIGNWSEELKWIDDIARRKSAQCAVICCVFGAVVAEIWKMRNLLRFQSGSYQEDRLCKMIATHIHIKGRDNVKWQEILKTMAPRP